MSKVLLAPRRSMVDAIVAQINKITPDVKGSGALARSYADLIGMTNFPNREERAQVKTALQNLDRRFNPTSRKSRFNSTEKAAMNRAFLSITEQDAEGETMGTSHGTGREHENAMRAAD